jgi:hypothetical protein
MAKKLSLNPDVSYMLGIYNCNSRRDSVCISTSNNEMVERFVKIAVLNLGMKPEYISVVKDGDIIEAKINSPKLKKLLEKALESRDRAFKYKNEYSASYFAGVFDYNGAIDRRGIFLRRGSAYDAVLLERLGFHTATSAGKIYIKNDKDFVMFIAPFSIRAQLLPSPRSKRHSK